MASDVKLLSLVKTRKDNAEIQKHVENGKDKPGHTKSNFDKANVIGT